jgi:hypothetical protein
MIKKTHLIPIFLLLVSCNQSIDPMKLIGSWKMTDPNDLTESERITFVGDSIVIEMFSNNKFTNKFSAKYEFDSGTNIIHYKLELINVDWEVLELTNAEMELQNPKDKKPFKFVRLK